MKITKLNDDQILCILERSELNSIDFFTESANVNATRIKDFFINILNKAYEKWGFYANANEITIRNYGLENKLIFLISKSCDMSPLFGKEDISNYSKIEMEEIINGILAGTYDISSASYPEEILQYAASSKKLTAVLNKIEENLSNQEYKENKYKTIKSHPFSKKVSFKFNSLYEVYQLSILSEKFARIPNFLYIDLKNNTPFMLFDFSKSNIEEASHLINIISEYASPMYGTYSQYYFEEHHTAVIRRNALSTIKKQFEKN